MPDSAADRVTINLRGIGDAVRSAAAARGLTIAAFAREALVSALGAVPPTRTKPFPTSEMSCARFVAKTSAG